MSLSKRLQKDMYRAMKTGDKVTIRALRRALSAIKDKRIAKREDLLESDEIKTLQGLAKQHQESIKLYGQGGRADLVASETAELSVLEQYLPRMMTEEETRELVRKVISEVGAKSLVDMNKVMPAVMKAGSHRVNGRLAQTIVKELLS